MSISQINLDKAVGIFNMYTADGRTASVKLESDKIRIDMVAGAAGGNVFLSWQVIEFY